MPEFDFLVLMSYTMLKLPSSIITGKDSDPDVTNTPRRNSVRSDRYLIGSMWFAIRGLS